VLAVPASARAITSAQCAARVNDTPSKLVECIQTPDLMAHMQHLQAIANANPSPADGHPSRNSGEPGYKASVDYVAQVMKDAGYDVKLQPYKFDYYAYTGVPSFSSNGTKLRARSRLGSGREPRRGDRDADHREQQRHAADGHAELRRRLLPG
jgi:hypothetical protein